MELTYDAPLGHPGLDDSATRQALGIVECRYTRRISSGKFMNFTRAESTWTRKKGCTSTPTSVRRKLRTHNPEEDPCC